MTERAGVAQRLDTYQRTHTWLGAPLAVIYKFFEDRGPYLAALVTYYAFVSLFPLLLIFTSAVGYVLQSNPSARQELISSALRDFPIIGPQLRENVNRFHGSGLALAVGIVVTLYGGMGAMQAAQTAFNRIYAVPRNEQPNPFKSRLRTLLLLFLLGGGVILSAGVATLAATSNDLAQQIGPLLRLLAVLLSFAVSCGVFTLAFQVLTAARLHTRQTILGGVLAGTSWELLQTFGASFVSHEFKHASNVYGTFGLVLTAVAWLYIQALAIMLSAEINVVVSRRLWPRALLTPFTDNVSLTDADRRTYRLHACTQRFKGFEEIHAHFDQSAAEPAEARTDEAAEDRAEDASDGHRRSVAADEPS